MLINNLFCLRSIRVIWLRGQERKVIMEGWLCKNRDMKIGSTCQPAPTPELLRRERPAPSRTERAIRLEEGTTWQVDRRRYNKPTTQSCSTLRATTSLKSGRRALRKQGSRRRTSRTLGSKTHSCWSAPPTKWGTRLRASRLCPTILPRVSRCWATTTKAREERPVSWQMPS